MLTVGGALGFGWDLAGCFIWLCLRALAHRISQQMPSGDCAPSEITDIIPASSLSLWRTNSPAESICLITGWSSKTLRPPDHIPWQEWSCRRPAMLGRLHWKSRSYANCISTVGWTRGKCLPAAGRIPVLSHVERCRFSWLPRRTTTLTSR